MNINKILKALIFIQCTLPLFAVLLGYIFRNNIPAYCLFLWLFLSIVSFVVGTIAVGSSIFTKKKWDRLGLICTILGVSVFIASLVLISSDG